MSILELIWPFFFPLVAAVIALIHIRTKNHHGTQALEIFLMWQIGVGLGLEYVYAGLGHLLFADQIAQSIGWPAGNPFQREVGIWDAAMGLIVLMPASSCFTISKKPVGALFSLFDAFEVC